MGPQPLYPPVERSRERSVDIEGVVSSADDGNAPSGPAVAAVHASAPAKAMAAIDSLVLKLEFTVLTMIPR